MIERIATCSLRKLIILTFSTAQAAPDNSLHFVYLFDSILKNIGGVYVSAIEARVNRMFLKVFQTVCSRWFNFAHQFTLDPTGRREDPSIASESARHMDPDLLYSDSFYPRQIH